MKKKITNNILLKIVSVVVAIILWIIVMNIEDPVNTRTFYNVPITVKNDNIITEQDKTYKYEPGDDLITVTVKAKRSVLTRITPTDIEAIADFKNLNLDALVPIELRVINFEGQYDSVEANPTNFRIEVKENKDSDAKTDDNSLNLESETQNN